MTPSIETLIRRHLQANDAIQDSIDFEEIVARLEDDQGVEKSQSVDARSAWDLSPVVTRGLFVAVAAAVITLLLFGLIPLLSGGEEIPPADTMPAPVTPTTVAAQDTTGDTEPQPAEAATAPMVFTATSSDPVFAEGPLTWRTVELPADGRLRVGLDDSIYLLTEDVIWVSRNGVEWIGYPGEPSLEGYSPWSAVGEDRLIIASGGGGIGGPDSEEPEVLLPVTVSIYDLSELESGEAALISQSPLPGSEGEGANSVAIGPHGALVATDRNVFYSENGDQWTPVEALQASPHNRHVAATNDSFYLVDGTTAFISTNGVQWTEMGELSSSTDRLRVWGDDVLTHDEFTIWRITPAGAEQIYESSVAFDMFGPGDVAGSDLGVVAVGLDLDGFGGVFDGDGRGYAYSSDGVDWEQGTLPDGWKVTNVFIEEPIAMNNEIILVIASPPESENGGVFDGNLVLIATP